eukprot:2445178-Prymnesium_polylepis.1
MSDGSWRPSPWRGATLARPSRDPRVALHVTACSTRTRSSRTPRCRCGCCRRARAPTPSTPQA